MRTPTDTSASKLERQFHREMLEIYKLCVRECNYRPTRFVDMVNDRGGLDAARALLAAPTPAMGLTTLYELGRLDLSMEALVCRDPWRTLFTADEIAVAEKRLMDFGYKG